MTDTTYLGHKKGGRSHNLRKPAFSLIDGVLVVGFLAAFTGLVCLLAK